MRSVGALFIEGEHDFQCELAKRLRESLGPEYELTEVSILLYNVTVDPSAGVYTPQLEAGRAGPPDGKPRSAAFQTDVSLSPSAANSGLTRMGGCRSLSSGSYSLRRSPLAFRSATRRTMSSRSRSIARARRAPTSV
jgi:hypothetical protein